MRVVHYISVMGDDNLSFPFNLSYYHRDSVESKDFNRIKYLK